jgi:hypothetical protein
MRISVTLLRFLWGFAVLPVGATCLVMPYTNGTQTTSGYNMLRCKSTDGKHVSSDPDQCRAWGIAMNNFHAGVDFGSSSPDKSLHAMSDGSVVFGGWYGHGYGNRIAIKRDDGQVYTYSHLSTVEPKFITNPGVTVPVHAGDKLGIEGGTASTPDEFKFAPHLHIEYWVNAPASNTSGYGSLSGYQFGRDASAATEAKRSNYMDDVRRHMCVVPPSNPHPYEAKIGRGPVQNNDQSPAGTDSAAASGEQVASAAQYNQVVDSQGRVTQNSVDENGTYGVPDAPPYAEMDGMSEAQLVSIEGERRASSTNWHVDLTNLSRKGLLMEIAYVNAARAFVDAKIARKREHIEALLAVLSTDATAQFKSIPLNEAHRQMLQGSAERKVN